MTTVRLVVGEKAEAMRRNFAGVTPAVLISYAYRKQLIPSGPLLYPVRSWALDSGAFTVHTTGSSIDLVEYIEFARARLLTDALLTEVFALDVIDNPEGSAKNTEAMWAAGIPAIPTFHSGEPWEYLTHMAARYPKIALGGAVNLGRFVKRRWAEQCFSRVYPKKIHGLGFGRPATLLAMPFHSADISSWLTTPASFGAYRGYADPFMLRDTLQLSTYTGRSFGVEAAWYLRLERYLKDYWAKEMALLEALPGIPLGATP